MMTKRIFLTNEDSNKYLYHAKPHETVDPDGLIPYEGNPKNHKDENVKELAYAIDKRGWTTCIVVDQRNRIISGHGRLKAAKMLKCRKVPITRLEVTDEDYFAIMLEDNKLASLSKVSKKLEREVMEILQGLDSAIEDIPGYNSEDIDKIFGLATKEVINGNGDFGDAGEVEGEIDPDARVVSMTFKLPAKNHKRIKDVLTAVQRENDLETLSEALIFCMSSFKGTTKTIRR